MAIKLTDRKWCAHADDYQHEFICDADADFENLPEAATGSTAVSIQSGKIMVVNTRGEWTPFGE